MWFKFHISSGGVRGTLERAILLADPSRWPSLIGYFPWIYRRGRCKNSSTSSKRGMIVKQDSLKFTQLSYDDPDSGIQIATSVLDLIDVVDNPLLSLIKFIWLMLAEN